MILGRKAALLFSNVAEIVGSRIEAQRAHQENILSDFVCGHRVPCHRLTGIFLACNRRHLKSWVGNFSEGPF
jgi:hypothetical protein